MIIIFLRNREEGREEEDMGNLVKKIYECVQEVHVMVHYWKPFFPSVFQVCFHCRRIISLWVFVDRKTMAKSGFLEFSCGFSLTRKKLPGLMAWNFPDGSPPMGNSKNH